MSGGVLPALVSAVDDVAVGVRRIVLRDPSGASMPAWEPGTHVDVICDEGGTARQYSLCGDIGDASSWTIAVRLVPDGTGGSRRMHRLAVGDRVGLSEPRNRFPLVTAERYLFVAGGIGITPILPMVRQARGSHTTWALFYAGRDRASMPFIDELEGDVRVRVWTDDVDGVPDTTSLVADAEPGTVVYCCGPAPMITSVRDACRSRGLEFRFEQFTAVEVDPDVAMLDESFEVQLSSSGQTVAVPADVSILDALLAAGVDVDYSCHEGTCGTCETLVLAGVPDHRDPLWSVDGPDDALLICVSRSRTPALVLDI